MNKILPRTGVAVLLWRGDRVLFGQRLSEPEPGSWQLPGGWLMPGEQVLQAAERELLEETGLKAAHFSYAGFTENEFSGMTSISLYVVAEYIGGDAEVKEPEKCACWQWYDYRSLPEPLFLPVKRVLAQNNDLKQWSKCRGIPVNVHI